MHPTHCSPPLPAHGVMGTQHAGLFCPCPGQKRKKASPLVSFLSADLAFVEEQVWPRAAPRALGVCRGCRAGLGSGMGGAVGWAGGSRLLELLGRLLGSSGLSETITGSVENSL